MFFQEVLLVPSGLQKGLEEVLIVLDAVHQSVPETPGAAQPQKLLPPPPDEPRTSDQSHVIRGGVVATDADHVLERYRRVGAAQGHTFGAGGVPNFNIEPSPAPAPEANSPQRAPEKP
jgi:rod shape-determining protein MreC